ncbi:MAG: 2-hydroxyglutaryl-CoA dehydratase [Anaerolineales bacterium]|nr:2-hydroxyglutaryl-CoA dehydratase [Anaerolineales bacterium]
MYFLGIDIGALTVKAVVLDGAGAVIASDLARSRHDSRQVAARLVEGMLVREDISAGEVGYTVVTGYGRVTYDAANEEVSEITCHARGAIHLFPTARTVIDIGGQDSKVIRVHPRGYVTDFAMNDKCAAGTGRFLEVMADALEVGVEELGPLAQQSRRPVAISSTCTVFAESEVIAQMSRGAPKADIVAGIHAAIASRVAGLAGQVGLEEAVVMTGGVAQNIGVVRALDKQIGVPILLPPEPQLVGALGAALLAKEKKMV